MSAKPILNFCTLGTLDIFSQLQIEEALLRVDDQNWCLINVGSPPAIVLGISGVVHELVDEQKLHHHPIPLIRRFSGGGTVVVDQNTLFISFIFSRRDFDLGNCPRKVMQWTEVVYKPVFAPESFSLEETDYTLYNKKIGGNAQYFSKERILHHTTFLWDFLPHHMSLLKMPKTTPRYRKDRNHEEFVDRLCRYYPSPSYLIDRLKTELSKQFHIAEQSDHSFHDMLLKPHRKALQRL
jgi:lipoate-protein ligase A